MNRAHKLFKLSCRSKEFYDEGENILLVTPSNGEDTITLTLNDERLVGDFPRLEFNIEHNLKKLTIIVISGALHDKDKMLTTSESESDLDTDYLRCKVKSTFNIEKLVVKQEVKTAHTYCEYGNQDGFYVRYPDVALNMTTIDSFQASGRVRSTKGDYSLKFSFGYK